jgi:TATA-binding protein-associated factor Taf7
VTYERLRAIFRKARYIHNPMKFTTEAGDEEENPYEEAERRVAEARNEERAESERRLAVLRRRVAELEQQIAEGRREAE